MSGAILGHACAGAEVGDRQRSSRPRLGRPWYGRASPRVTTSMIAGRGCGRFHASVTVSIVVSTVLPLATQQVSNLFVAERHVGLVGPLQWDLCEDFVTGRPMPLELAELGSGHFEHAGLLLGRLA